MFFISRAGMQCTLSRWETNKGASLPCVKYGIQSSCKL